MSFKNTCSDIVVKVLNQKWFGFLALAGIVQCPLFAREDFISHESTWRYLNGDTVPPDEWKDREFDDSQWATGLAPLGYGEYKLRTYIRSEKSPRPLTTFFRSCFFLDDPSAWESLVVEYKADDGAVVYLNGKPVSTFNMAGPPFDSQSRAVRTIGGWVPYYNEELHQSALKYLVKGKNTIAISGHQSNESSSDLNLEFALTGIERGIQKKVLMESGSPVKFSDQAQLPDDDWAEVDYDDGKWKTGKGLFGYGFEDAVTQVEFGDDPSNKPICVWFRKEFEIPSDMDVKGILVTVRYDDAATFFLNGKELFRHNLPFGYSDHQTVANDEFSSWSSQRIREFRFPVKGGLVGKNVLAVQVHGSGPQNPDLCFEIQKLSVEYFPQEAVVPVIVKNVPESGPKTPIEQKLIKVASAEAVASASPTDWAYSSKSYLDLAIAAYEKENLETAQRAYTASRWAGIFSGEGAKLNPALKHFILAAESLKTAQEFLDLYSALDEHDRVYEILDDLFLKEEKSFRSYANLAMAIAVVYDQSPPNSWPHHQVGQAILPRRLPDPLEAFRFWVESDQKGKTLHALGKLGIGELKYVVDSPASLEELAAAQGLGVRLSNLSDLYPGVEYSHERLAERRYDWPYSDYSLPRIQKEGGICVDQAYYTSQVAKACGVPAMMVTGAGSNGNHAWVGFLDQRERWDFEIGRYEESKFVTGLTFDPQTWQQPTDHELSLLTERFQTSPRFQLSRVHSIFAKEYLERDQFSKAVKASELAIKSEARNFEAWNLLLKSKKNGGSDEKELRLIYENGAKTFGRIADLEAYFLKRQANSLRNDGEEAAAEKIRDRIISRNRRERPDLALQESKDELDKLIESGEIDDQLTFYKQQIQKLKDAGLVTYYGLTQPFLEHLRSKGALEQAQDALDYTTRKMEFEEGSQLAEELENWKKDLGGK